MKAYLKRPPLFHLSDLSIMWIPAFLVSMMIITVVWNCTSPDGEAIPWPGWLVSSLMVLGCIGIVVAFYWTRWKWIQKFAYRVLGVEFYFEPNATRYLVVDIEPVVAKVLKKWCSYLKLEGAERSEFMRGSCIHGVVCTFRPEDHWNQAEQGYWSRKVTGLSGDNWIMVGQGSRTVEQTAFGHELSHIILNRSKGYTPEEQAHQIFITVGV